MDVLQLLSLAYNGEKKERTAATAQLDEIFDSKFGLQHLVTILRAGMDQTLPTNQSFLALIYAKNYIMNTLTFDQADEAPEIFEEVKSLLYNGAFCAPKTHRKIIHASVSTIISIFEWNYLPQLMPEITRDRAAVPVEQALASLQMLYLFVKRFKMPFLDPASMRLSVSCGLLTTLPAFLSYRSFEVDHLVFKLIECVVRTALETKNVRKLRSEAFDQWFCEMAQYPERHFASSREAASNGLLSTYEMYIRCLKRISMISFSVITSATREKMPPPLAKHFLTTYALAFFGVWQRWLEHSASLRGESGHKKVDIFAIHYIKLCSLDQKFYQQHLLPQLPHVLESILFPFLCLNEEDEAVFVDSGDLAEFSRYMMEEGFTAGKVTRRQVASNAILALVVGKKEFHVSFLQKTIDFLTLGLSREDNEETAPQTFGFLHLLSVLRKHLREVSDIWKTQMSQVLIRFVIPRVLQTVPFVPLRCKAIVVCQRYSKAPMQSEEHFASFVQLICSLVRDADPRIRLGAIDAVCTLLEMKRALPYIKPFLQTLVEECISFLDQIQTNFVPAALRYLAKHFAPELTPLLSRIGKKLVQSILAISFDVAQKEEMSVKVDIERFSAVDMSAYTLLDALDTVVSASTYNTEVLCSLRPDLVFFARQVLESPEGFDYVEKTLSILLSLLNFSKPIPAECWDLLPVLFSCVNSGIGVDFFSLIEEVLDSYVSNGTVEYMQNTDIMEATYQICEKVLFNPVCETKERIAVPQLIEAMLHQSKHCGTANGLFDIYLSRFVSLLLRALANETSTSHGNVRLQVWIVAALMDAFYYDASATLHIIDCNNAKSQFFDALFMFFRGAINSHDDEKNEKKRRRGRGKKDDGAHEVVESLSILTRKVITLGLTALLMHLTVSNSNSDGGTAGFCGANGNNTLDSFDKYLIPTLSLIQHCIFKNNELLLLRCRVTENNLKKIREGIEEEDVVDFDFDEDFFLDDDYSNTDDVVVEDDYTNDNIDNNNNNNNDYGDDLFAYCPDEGDEYESPIDDVCEVSLFLQWVARAATLGDRVLSRIQCSMTKSLQEFRDAEATALRYRRLVREFDCALDEEHKARCSAAPPH